MSGAEVQERKRPLLWRLGRTPKTQRKAVIDIGSNSVRLIIYQLNGRSIIPRVNEKVMAGLGEGLSETGRLPENGVKSALSALSRYAAICASFGVTEVFAFATAAVRDAKDGAEFCRAVKVNTGISVHVFSGADEARYTALGVVAAQRDPTGLVGDLGGSSLELVTLNQGVLSAGKTYRLGPLALVAKDYDKPTKVEASILKELHSKGPLVQMDDFFAVGGAWRAFAKIYMHYVDYPLHVLQSFKIPVSDAIALADLLIERKSKIQDLAKSVGGKRYAMLPLTAHVLKLVLLETGARTLNISAYGVREGVVYSGMTEDIQRLDPLLAGVTTLAKPDTGQASFSKGLSDFLYGVLSTLPPVFADDPSQEERLITAAFILADIGATMHPDHRADIARQLVLRGPYTGIDHSGRTFLGLITAYRYYRKFAPTDLELESLTQEQIDRARLIAHLIRVAAEFSCRTERLLRKGKLRIEDDSLVLSLVSGQENLISDGVQKRLAQAASLMGLKSRTA